jgi:hypothetical protein
MRSTALLALALAVLGVGCGSEDDGAPPPGSFYGLYGDAGEAEGTITLSGVSPATAPLLLGGGSPVALAGSLDISGQLPVDLTGQYLADSGALSFESEGGAYIFTGQVTQQAASGTSTGPNGAGTFALFTGGTPGAALVFCGQGKSISFNLAVSGSTALITAFTEGAAVSAVGTRSGDFVAVHIVSGEIDITVQGTMNGPAIGGTWTDNVNSTGGLWSGSTGQCSASAALRH